MSVLNPLNVRMHANRCDQAACPVIYRPITSESTKSGMGAGHCASVQDANKSEVTTMAARTAPPDFGGDFANPVAY